MKTLTTALLAGAALLGATAAQAQTDNEWIYIGNAGDGTHEHIRPGYDSDEGYQRTWVKSTHQPGRDPDGYVVSLFQFDCAEHRAQTLHADLYDRTGNVIDSHGAYEWLYIAPETVASNVAQYACHAQ